MLFSDYHLAKLNPQLSYELFGLFVTEKMYPSNFQKHFRLSVMRTSQSPNKMAANDG